MEPPFRFFIGNREVLNNAELSIAEAAHPITLKINLTPKPIRLRLLLVNLTRDICYYFEEIYTESRYKDYSYINYPIDPGVYIFYIFEPGFNFRSPALFAPNFSKNYKPADFGDLVVRFRFFVKAKSNLLQPNLLPLDIQKYLIEQNFNIYEILDFCGSTSSSICNDLQFWKLLARNRLTGNQAYVVTKNQVIEDLKKAESILSTFSFINVHRRYTAIVYLRNFEIVLRKLRKVWNQDKIPINLVTLLYEYFLDHINSLIKNTYYFDVVSHIIHALFNLDITPSTNIYVILEEVISKLTDYEFEVAYSNLMEHKNNNEMFKIFLSYINPEEWNVEIAKYNQNNHHPFIM
jgi:hypothetical protein